MYQNNPVNLCVRVRQDRSVLRRTILSKIRDRLRIYL